MKESNNYTPNLRIQSVDILRGVIMLLMAIDHVRVYSGIPANSSEPALFLTRWITHFCAPGFVFLTGLSAFLYEQKVKSKKELSKFLFTRGLILILLELTLIRFFWTFNLNFSNFILAGVIWMIGWCMIIMAVLVRLNPRFVLFIGLFIIFFQQAFSLIPKILPSIGKYWEFIYSSGWKGEQPITILYVLIPWIGVMALGYSFGMVISKPEKQRNKICGLIGGGSILLFFIIAIYLTIQNPSSKLSFPLQVLNQKKYPASQLFLLMTLGPIIAFIPLANRVKGWFANVLSIFGKVPMFYYLLHILFIHFSALLINYLLFGSTNSLFYNTAPYTEIDTAYRWGLPLLYLTVLINILLLYFVCRWYAKIKMNNTNPLLKYL